MNRDNSINQSAPAVNLRVGQVARLSRQGYTFILAEPDGVTEMTADEAREYIDLMQQGGYRATAPRNLFNMHHARWFEVDIERTRVTPKINPASIGRDDQLAGSFYGQ